MNSIYYCNYDYLAILLDINNNWIAIEEISLFTPVKLDTIQCIFQNTHPIGPKYMTYFMTYLNCLMEKTNFLAWFIIYSIEKPNMHMVDSQSCAYQ